MSRRRRPGRIRQAAVVVLKITISLGLLAILWTRVDTSRLLAILVHALIAWLAVALGLYFLMVAASAWRWGLLLRAQEVVSRATLLRSFLVATFFNNFLPMDVHGRRGDVCCWVTLDMKYASVDKDLRIGRMICGVK